MASPVWYWDFYRCSFTLGERTSSPDEKSSLKLCMYIYTWSYICYEFCFCSFWVNNIHGSFRYPYYYLTQLPPSFIVTSLPFLFPFSLSDHLYPAIPLYAPPPCAITSFTLPTKALFSHFPDQITCTMLFPFQLLPKPLFADKSSVLLSWFL